MSVPSPPGARRRRLWLLLVLPVGAGLFVTVATLLVKRQRALEAMAAARDYLAISRQNFLYLYGDEESPAPGYLLNDKQVDASQQVRDMYLKLANRYGAAIADLEQMIADGIVLAKPQVISMRLVETSPLADGSVHRSLIVEWLEIERGKSDEFAGIYVVDQQGTRHDFAIPTDVSGRLWEVPNPYRQHVIILAKDVADLSDLGSNKFALVLKLSPADRKLIEGDRPKAGLLLRDGSVTDPVTILRAE
jgi:hypothetical protein